MDYAANSPTIYTQAQHGMAAHKFDRRAMRIAMQLIDAGFEAYLVGGCLRDSLLKREPKDFDIATNARPEEVAGLFRNCRLIGRRFRLAHIHFGRDIIEVATFRAGSDDAAKTDSDGHVLEDNQYGSMEEDVVRRDFTINALYYNPANEVLIDYLGAMQDLHARTLRLIGDPVLRYTQDPVRMLRAARFAAKLDMQLETQTEAAIATCREGLKSVPPARLFDEAQKLFMSGYGEKSYQEMKRLDLLAMLFPDVARVLAHRNRAFADYADRVIGVALRNTDKRIAEEKPVTIAFLFAAFLWPVFQLQYQGLLQSRDWHSAMHEAVDLVLIAAAERISIPVRLRGMIREIWTLQARFDLTGNSPRKTRSLLSHPRFRAAFDFLMVRAAAGEDLAASVRWWEYAQAESGIVPSAADDSDFDDDGFAAPAPLEERKTSHQKSRRRRSSRKR